MSLEFCEHFPDEFPMMDTFKIIGDLMQQIVERRIDMRPIFRRNDLRRDRFLNQQQFVAVLDSQALTQVLYVVFYFGHHETVSFCLLLSFCHHFSCRSSMTKRC